MTDVAAAEALILANMPRFPASHEPLAGCAGRVLAEEVESMRQLYQTIDRPTLEAFAEGLGGAAAVYVAGARLSYTFAYYLGWSLAKVRKGVTILKGSDSTVFDRLNNAGAQAMVANPLTGRARTPCAADARNLVYVR